MIEVLEPAPTHDLTVAETVKRELGVTGTEHDAVLSDLIRQASRTAATSCNRVFAKETVRETLRPEVPFRRLVLDRHPVVCILSIVEDNGTLSAADYELDVASGLVTRLVDDLPTDWRADKIVITYVAGYDLLTNLPEDVEKAVIALVRGWWFGRARDPLVKAQEIPGVMRQDYWVGAVGDGGLPPEFETLLAPYRNVAVA
ncbi:MAG: phage head-tail connector protein [Reyranellaceae bacterium]